MRFIEQPIVKHIFRCEGESQSVIIRMPYISAADATEKVIKAGRKPIGPPVISVTGSLAMAFDGESPDKLPAIWKTLLAKPKAS